MNPRKGGSHITNVTAIPPIKVYEPYIGALLGTLERWGSYSLHYDVPAIVPFSGIFNHKP